VEARQLKAIARQFDVDWQPASNGDRAVLEWPGRPLKREAVLAAVRTALVAQGAAPDCEIEIPAFVPPLVPLTGVAAPSVAQLDYDRDLGRFTALLSVAVAGADPIAARVGGQVVDVVSLPVLATRLPAGAIPGPDDLRMARVRVAAVQTEVAREPGAAIGMQLKRPLPAGVPIPLSELMRPTEVGRGAPVRMTLDAGGLSVSGEGIALEQGAAGDRIRVRNISSQAVLEAMVVRTGVVRVLPGTAPITAQARLGLSAARGG
jgi:flagella basal body P-ring formation protein FlgA